ncbi:folate-binding protein [Zavarzinia compransoris]|uniref:CAF17-like 4Fe-4S cluster assembly/insertion protein YgfZ n=1 Tax=Zavarzinia marina TaxID=2911065 RepID=UPI001F3A374B|nr:folate-binding protein [Zavarzinia marina]MCF4166052.1 folate-binding protein [Zavarzinia marina]
MTTDDRPAATRLTRRGVLALEGAEVTDFLQGLVSNDTKLLTPEHALFAALLTPQGKFLHELIMARAGDRVLIDSEAERLPDLQRRLTMYRLRAKIDIAPAADAAVIAVFGPGAADAFGLAATAGAARPLDGGASAFVDPRVADLGVRLIGPQGAVEAALAAAGITPDAPEEAYDRLRIGLGVPDGSRDIAVDRGFLLENNFEELHGVSFTKGCYVGQELTARTKHRATIRKRLYRVEFDPAAEVPAPDTPILLGGREAGAMRSAVAGVGLAVMRLEYMDPGADEGQVFVAGDTVVRPSAPPYLAGPAS